MADTTRDVELRLRASNLTNAGLKEAITNLNALEKSLESQAEAAKKALTAHKAAMDAGTASGKAAETQLKSYERSLSAVEKQLQTNRNSLARFNAELARQAAEAQRAEISGHLTAFNARVEANRKAVDDLRKFNAETKLLTAQRHADETRQARQAVEDIRRINRQGQETQLQQAIPGGPRTDAMGRPGRGAAGQIGFLGLRPYELTNLGYQVNDVISGLVSGQNVTQILAQQGGQFIQIFGRAALRWFPAVAVAIGAVTIAAEALTARLQTLSSNREFTALLQTNKYALDQNAESLTALRKELRDVGVSWEDAGKAIRTALDANVRPERMREVLIAARDMARVTGVDVPEATKDLVEGINGGIDAFDKLLAKYPAIGAENAKYIRDLFLAGKEGRAQIEIVRLLGEEYAKAARDKLSPFETATEKLSASWHKFTDDLGKSSAFDTAITKITQLVEWIDRMIQRLDTLVDSPNLQRALKAFEFLSKYNPAALVMTGIGVGQDVIGRVGDYASGRAPSVASANVGNEDIVRNYLSGKGYSPSAVAGIMGNIAVESRFDPSARNPSGHFGLTQWDKTRQAPLGGSTDIIKQLDLLDSELSKLDPTFKTAAQSAEQMALRFERVFERSGGQLNAQRVAAARKYYGGDASAFEGPGVYDPSITTPTATTTAAGAAAIRNAQQALDIARAASQVEEERVLREQARIRLQERGIVGQQQADAIEKEIALFTDRKKTETYEREQTRGRQRIQDGRDAAAIEVAGAKAVADAQASGITNYEKLYDIRIKGEAEARADIQKRKQEQDQLDTAEKRVDELRRQNLKEHKSAIENITEAINLRYDNEIKQLEKLRERASTVDQERYSALIKRVEAERQTEIARAPRVAAESQARDALAARNDLVQTYTKLEAAGEISITEKNAKIKEAFDLTRASILEAAAALEKFLNTPEGKNLPETEIARLTARIKELRAETKYIDPWWKGLRETFTESLTTGLETAFNTVSEAIGGAIAKTKEWKDVFVSVRQAGIQLFAQLLKDIATYILKAEAAKIASSLFSGSGEGGGFSFGGLFSKLLGFGSQTGGTGLDYGAGGAALGVPDVFGVPSLRSGGVIGRVPATRLVSWWANAPRYKTGTVVGLAPDEQRAILHNGEEVLSADNPRNIMNGGGGRGEINIRNVLVDDRARVPEAMTGAHGERVVIQHLVNNAATIRELVRDAS